MTKAAKKNAKRKDKKPSEHSDVDGATQSITALRYECSQDQRCSHCLCLHQPECTRSSPSNIYKKLVCSISDSPEHHEGPPGLSGNKKQTADTPTTASTANSSFSTAPGAAAADASTAGPSAADVLQNSGAAAPPASQDTEKQLRNLRKKIRQADATAKKAAEGLKLTPEEQEKLQRLEGW